MSRILVTGAAGFIGFHVAKALLEAGDTVVGLDNFNDYYAPELKRARWEILRRDRNFIPLETNLADRDAVARCFREFVPDLVCHMAAQAGVRYSLQNPYVYQQSNLEGFLNLIEEARLQPVNRFVYASSSSVYGGNSKTPWSEDDPVNTPVSLYAATKRADELMAYAYTHVWGLQTVGLRLFTVYGPWGRPDMAYWSFLERMLHDEPIKVFNYGKNSRDFTFVDDVVQGVVAALAAESLDQYDIINLGNNRPVGVTELIQALEEFSGTRALKEMVPAQPGDVITTYADIEKARRKLGFDPKTSLREGLETFVKWYLNHREMASAVRGFRLSKG